MYGGVQDAQGYEVFKSVDGGQNWNNITTSTLDNINATNIVHQRGSDGGVYLGTRNTVYYKNNNMQDWKFTTIIYLRVHFNSINSNYEKVCY